MTTRKRNEWLEADASDEEGNQSAYEDGVAQDSRVEHTAKRRKFSPVYDDYSDASSNAGEPVYIETETLDVDTTSESANVFATSPERSEQGERLPRRSKSLQFQNKKSRIPPNASKSKASATGVIYLSRVPPFMKPQTVKHLLEPYGNIGRIFLTPEDPTSHSRRVKSGGNKKRSFTDGWVEFQSKKDAKIVAETLNAHIIGGKKGGWYHDDVWNIKYLKGFKWHHLTEQIANENAERAARLRAEISQTTKENKRFVANVERAKMLEGMQVKKQRKIALSDPATASNLAPNETISKRQISEKRHFRQNEVKGQSSKSGFPKEQSEQVNRVLAKIF